MFNKTAVTVRLDAVDAAIINDMRRAKGLKRMTPEMLAVNRQRDLVKARQVCHAFFQGAMGGSNV